MSVDEAIRAIGRAGQHQAQLHRARLVAADALEAAGDHVGAGLLRSGLLDEVCDEAIGLAVVGAGIALRAQRALELDRLSREPSAPRNPLARRTESES